MKDFNLLGNRVIIQILESQPETVSGIIMPTGTPERFCSAVVKKTTISESLDQSGVEIDEVILVDRHACARIVIDREVYQIIKSEDVIAILR